MADGMNHVRAIRLAEIVQDFRSLQQRISQIQMVTTAEEYYGAGQTILRECLAEGHRILAVPFAPSADIPDGDPELEKAHIQRVILDANARRFQAQRIYLRATAAMRWINAHNARMQEHEPGPQREQAITQVNQALEDELSGITDERVLSDLHDADTEQARWVDEDPNLDLITEFIASM